MKAGLMKPRLLLLGSQDIAKAAIVADMSESGVLLHCSTNVAGMSWPVRYNEVATLAQECFEGLSPRNDGVQAPIPDG